MYAIIKTGGKQIKVSVGDKVFVEKIETSENDEIIFNEVLLVNGEKSVVGSPLVKGASVKAKLIKEDKHRKVVVFRYHSKANVRVKRGHRQPYSYVEITEINI